MIAVVLVSMTYIQVFENNKDFNHIFLVEELIFREIWLIEQ